MDRAPVKVVLVWAILISVWIGKAAVSRPIGGSLVWVALIVAFGIFNAVYSAPGTAWVRGTTVVATMATLLWGRMELYALGAWIAWPPAYMVSWSLAREGAPGAPPETSADEDTIFTPARINLAALIIALAIASTAYRLIFVHGLHQSSVLFIGIPVLLAVVVLFMVSPKSAAGVACKAVTIGLLLSLLVLGEGVLCVIMAAPLFYAVAIGTATGVEWIRGDDKRTTLRSCAILLPLIPMMLEGVSPATSFNRQETVTVTRVLQVSPDRIGRAVLEYPRFDRSLPFLLRAGFPTPDVVTIDATSPRPRWVITFRGGEMRIDGLEPRRGDLVLELVYSHGSVARWRAISDTSHVTHYLRWKEVTLRWEPRGSDQTLVTCTVSYSRDLDPAWYFGPWQRFAVRHAADYLIDTVATP